MQRSQGGRWRAVIACLLLTVPTWGHGATIVEDFEIYSPGPLDVPFQFRGFELTGEGRPRVDPIGAEILSSGCVGGERCLSMPADDPYAGGASFVFGSDVIGFKIDVDLTPGIPLGIDVYWETYSASDSTIVFGYSRQFDSGTVELPRNPFGFLSDERLSFVDIIPFSVFLPDISEPSIIRSYDNAVTTVIPLPASLLLLAAAAAMLASFRWTQARRSFMRA